jgi:hypothetical protein
MASFNELADDVLSMLRGYVRSQEQVTSLTSGINDTATTLSVSDGKRVAQGRAEIDDEIIYIESVNLNSVVLQPWGRGVDGSQAQSHASGVKVTYNPLFPRYYVKRAINDTIMQIGARIGAIATHTLTFNAARAAYSLPAETEGILQVSWSEPGAARRWLPARKFRFDKAANLSDFPTGKSIDLYDPIVPGRTVQVRYTKNPSLLVAASDDLTSDAGLPVSCRDVVVMGTCARLVSGIDVAILDPSSVQAGFFDERRQPGSASSVARTLYALYQTRLAEEEARFRAENPTAVHFER